jgi:hypothetical protein
MKIFLGYIAVGLGLGQLHDWFGARFATGVLVGFAAAVCLWIYLEARRS